MAATESFSYDIFNLSGSATCTITGANINLKKKNGKLIV